MPKIFGESAEKIINDEEIRLNFFKSVYNYLVDNQECHVAISGDRHDCEKAAEMLRNLFEDVCRRSASNVSSLTNGLDPRDPRIHIYAAKMGWVIGKLWNPETGTYIYKEVPTS